MPKEHKASLPDTVTHMLEECRMVLPGVQALFGFQLIAVFNQVFWDRLDGREQTWHFIATVLVALSIVLVMTPAAYHRQAEPESVSRNFLILSTRVLFWSMFPLMTAILIELYVIGRLIFASVALPRHARLQQIVRRARM